MEIERINENTIKFYISYVDIEDRGFEREEIWYNRERSEQLFWQMMEEVNGKEEFTIEGPLWIQVQALEKGLEVVVTRSQMSKDDDDMKILGEDKTIIDLPVDERIEKLLENKFGKSKEMAEMKESEEPEEPEDELSMTFLFDEFENIIQLSHYLQETTEYIEEALYSYEGKYYLYVEFTEKVFEEGNQDDLVSQILEYANKTNISIHMLEEYGTVIFAAKALPQISSFFSVE